MAKLGLLGAIGGLGEGIQQIGLDMAKRRERALEEARLLAKEQRDRAERSETRRSSEELRVGLFEAGQERQDIRAKASQEAITGRQASTQEFQRSERLARAEASKDLARYRAGLSASNTQAAIDYRKRLEQGDVKGIKPGRVRQSDGFVEVIGVRKDGKAFPTGQWVVPNFFKTPTQTFGRAGGAEDESLEPDLEPLPEEEEEEEGWF